MVYIVKKSMENTIWVLQSEINGHGKFILLDCPGGGWKRGKIQRSHNYKVGKESPNAGKKWWNNGVNEIFANINPDDSWFKGRIKKAYLYEKRKPLTIEHKEKISKALKRKISILRRINSAKH